MPRPVASSAGGQSFSLENPLCSARHRRCRLCWAQSDSTQDYKEDEVDDIQPDQPEDDTEGHKVHRFDGSDETEDDTEGHLKHR